MDEQLGLFGVSSSEDDGRFGEERDLAKRLPSRLRLGTSSWTFRGWGDGLVYPGRPSDRVLRERGLEMYAEHPLFRTVGVDRSFYRPMAAADWERYSRQLPDDFLCVSKAFGQFTNPRGDSGAGNQLYLNASEFEALVLAPIGSARQHHGPVLLQFSPMPVALRPSARQFADQLDRFFSNVSSEFEFAVELRNRELMTPRYLDVLRRHGVAHVLNHWEQMPDVGTQAQLPGILTADFCVVRLLIPPGERYADRKEELEPFNRLASPQPKMREDTARFVAESLKLDKVMYVMVNNKAEGCSPLTIRALAERLADLENKSPESDESPAALEPTSE
ncbi:MAG: DUF72 domain-containing protein [Polyangiaceae bacterium]|nr:DUF72 domain-containing protein [Polyangiaceae bacterium]